MSQTASSGSTSASKDATLEPTEKCSTIYGLRKDELEARNNARGLATEWQDGTVMTKEELIAEEHMWEMRIPEDLKVSMRSFVAELERDLVPQVRAKGEALGIPATSTVKSDMIGDILLSIRGLHSRGEALPSLEDVLKKGGKVSFDFLATTSFNSFRAWAGQRISNSAVSFLPFPRAVSSRER